MNCGTGVVASAQVTHNSNDRDMNDCSEDCSTDRKRYVIKDISNITKWS